MKISTQEYRFKDSVFPSIWPCDVEDVNGNIIGDGHIIYFDTETGVVVSSVTDPSGQFVIWDSPHISGAHGILELVEVYPAPLKMIPYDPNNHVSPSHTVNSGS